MIEKLLNNRYLELISRIILGVVFISASIHKIIDPASFAKIIFGYGLFPDFSINLFAITLPYIELFSGAALITGFKPKGAALIMEVLLFSFIIAISINLIRGHEFDCGCFSVGEQGSHSSAVQLLIRDIVLFFLGLISLFFKSARLFAFSRERKN
ncbi:MAG: MauE/DoxX family redox-associated membrane protein [Fibrobacterota bacterium]